jgi:Tfp pilus assembly protein PilX
MDNQKTRSGGALAAFITACAVLLILGLSVWIALALIWDSPISRRIAMARALRQQRQVQAAQAAQRAAELRKETTTGNPDSATAATPED